MKELVSIIIPFYKVEKEIIRCLDSVVVQTYDNLEIICVGRKDDDVCINIVNGYVKKYENINCYFQDKKGLGNAKNIGKKYATGDFILFLDGDDYVEKNTVELLVKKALKEKSDIVCCGFDRIDEKTGKIYSKEMINIDYDNLLLNEKNLKEIIFVAPCSWGKLYRSNIISDIEFLNEEDEIEDLTFFLDVIRSTKSIAFIKMVLWHYLVRENSIICNVSAKKAYKLNNRLIQIRNKYANDLMFLQVIDVIAYIHLAISMTSRILSGDRSNSRKYLNNIKNSLDTHFVYWDKIKIRKNNKISIKTLILSFSRLLLKCNCLLILIWFYNFIIKIFKIDVKW